MGFLDGSDISWTICKQSTPRFRQITTPTPHHSIFTGRMFFRTPSQQGRSPEGNISQQRTAELCAGFGVQVTVPTGTVPTGSIPTGIVPTGTVPTSATPGHYSTIKDTSTCSRLNGCFICHLNTHL